ncbi:MAG: class I SAM-dependent methyltransferase [Anaerolineae bacterium]
MADSRLKTYLEAWKQEEREPFTGWDFSYLEGRMIEDQPPWSYPSRAAELMGTSSAVLDMGTGGGERLLRFRPNWPDLVVVTEDYAPNVRLAGARLIPQGASVVEVPLERTKSLPFADGSFDLVLNRHSGLSCAEVARVLAPGGAFLTQQIHGLWAQDLLAAFGARPQWPDATPELYGPCLTRAGLVVERLEDWRGELVFTDVGALVYYLKAVPWLVPGFSVDTHLDSLLRLQSEIEREGRLVFEARKYLIEARKPAGNVG